MTTSSVRASGAQVPEASPQSQQRKAGNAQRRRNRDRPEAVAGWTYVAPVIIILVVFLVVPIFMALYVSFSDWRGNGSPFDTSTTHLIGFKNYALTLTTPGISQENFGLSIRNILWSTIISVPSCILLALVLAVVVNNRLLRAKGFFRTALYFPSVTSSVAITVLWLFLFGGSGTINGILAAFHISGPNWFNDPSGLFQLIFNAFGYHQSTAPFSGGPGTFLGGTWFDWIGGPSVAMTAFIIQGVYTASGTFMLIFLSALQAIGEATEEAALIDGASSWQRFWLVTLPQLRPSIYAVFTLQVIGSWQLFDQVYTGTRGAPAGTTLTPAYLSYATSFNNQFWGQGAAVAFVLFIIIILSTLLLRWLFRER